MRRPCPTGGPDTGAPERFGAEVSAIQKELEFRLGGFYMAATEAARKVEEEDAHAFFAFAQEPDVARSGGEFGLLLEAVLSVPHCQVSGYTRPRWRKALLPGRPVFDPGGASRLAGYGLHPEADSLAMLRRLDGGVPARACT